MASCPLDNPVPDAAPKTQTDPEPEIRLNGARLTPDISGGLYWPDRRTLIVADLHFEKGSAFARRGSLLPPYDTRATLLTLEAAIDRRRPERVICLGDSFDDLGAADRMAAADRTLLARLVAAQDWLWIAGNHDPTPPADLGGQVAEESIVGPLLFRHEAFLRPRGVMAAGEVSGHFHPKALVATRARRHRGPCFISDGRRLILPAFGAYTGGLFVTDPAIGALFPSGFDIWLLGKRRIHRLPGSAVLR